MKIAARLKRIFGRRRDSIRFTGDFKSWDDAEKQSTGYSAPQILEKTRTALLKVKAGTAAFERDSMAFDQMEYEFSLLTGLLRAAAADQGQLSVLDFGGSLGGTYFQCRAYLSAINRLRWSVVDQPAHVACGKADFASDELRFYESVEACLREESPNVLLLSGVLQYLPQPYVFLEDVLSKRFRFVIVERTAFNSSGPDRLTIQHVPAWLYDASYPAWFFNEPSFRRAFASGYDLICEYSANDKAELEGGKAIFKGFQFKRKELSPRNR